MKLEILKYCMCGIIRHLNGDIDEFQRLAQMAYTHQQLEIHLFFNIGDVIPIETVEKMYMMTAA
jgi:hypothetical protein